MKTRLTPADRKILLHIREMVEKTHWTKHHYYRKFKSGKNKGKEQYCLVGFVNKETLPPEYAHEGSYRLWSGLVPERKRQQRLRLLNRIQEEIPTKQGIQSFNDDHKTHREDVLAVIDRALGKRKS